MIYARSKSTTTGSISGDKLYGLGRCPHCSVASPNMNNLWSDSFKNLAGSFGWATYRCSTCNGVVSSRLRVINASQLELVEMYPESKRAHEDIPQPARTFLQQAYETLHAPDAAAVMAGSAVDGMLKAKDYLDGSLYARIDKALEDNLLTKGMADWAHSVRLGSNRPRHSDADKPHVSPDEAKQSVEFAEALGNFLFVLTAKIDRGIQQAAATSA